MKMIPEEGELNRSNDNPYEIKADPSGTDHNSYSWNRPAPAKKKLFKKKKGAKKPEDSFNNELSGLRGFGDIQN